ncbi:hypothetical protein GUITHDRAFT_112705 [Guillardia theta CCMP2712]|uniref:Methyltransferase FkbM domain-containing protein n=1 Tax=Guillardia theta (strain CCMP2712) TaxID=905079 RepID=L1IZB2_GUITC|nr:hypothetical protein GUITHDRAFT_112705 [Guillardia theta CCMP2712]EKX41234.1 hypothetical protein GUITHDRAFT_112705 [Guillardia theta CCMP2712]|eukprot:XP_005828214.1 hypothetical protein GUITHDRAFT_112705 [Guillardia theta CCMP2712]
MLLVLLVSTFQLGPFAPPPLPPVTLKEREVVETATTPRFDIFVHPSSEDRYISLSLQREGIWEDDVHRRMQQLLGRYRDGALLDVGANIGFHSLAAAAAGHDVIAVEPVDQNCLLFNKSIIANSLNNIRLHKLIAGNESDARKCMHVSDINKGHSFVRPQHLHHDMEQKPHGVSFVDQIGHVVSRILSRSSSEAPASVLEDYHHQRHSLNDCEFHQSTTLDQVLRQDQDISQRLLVAKFDVEGYELQSLAGMRSTLLSPSAPCYLLVELFPRLLEQQRTRTVRERWC